VAGTHNTQSLEHYQQGTLLTVSRIPFLFLFFRGFPFFILFIVRFTFIYFSIIIIILNKNRPLSFSLNHSLNTSLYHSLEFITFAH